MENKKGIFSMKFILLTLILFYSANGFSKVEICHRHAEILKGLVDHYWIKTDTKEAGMGSELLATLQIGDKFEAPYTTKVFIVDHSNQTAIACKENLEVDEDCVNEQLDLGKPLGHFSLINNCQSFVARVIKKCSPHDPNEELYPGANG
jgi:hypothetical protein